MSTQSPASSSSRPPSAEPRARSPRATPPSAPQRARSDRRPAALERLQSEPRLLCGILVESDEVGQGNGEVGLFGGSKRIDSQRVLEARDDDCKAQRVETRLRKRKTIGQRRQFLVLVWAT